MTVKGYDPRLQIIPAVAVGSVTPSIPLLTVKNWAQVLNVLVAYQTQLLSAPIVTMFAQDVGGHILWIESAAALAVNSLCTIKACTGVNKSVANLVQQTLELPMDMLIPPDGQLIFAAAAANAADVLAAAVTYSY